MSIDWHIDFNPTEKFSKRRRKANANRDDNSAYLGVVAPTQGPGGLFQNITDIQGNPQQVSEAKAKLNQLIANYSATATGINPTALMGVRNTVWDSLLPAGNLKRVLMSSGGSLWDALKIIPELLKGRKYTSGDYVLGERLSDQILCNKDIGRKDVSDEMVTVAHKLFNILFGVRIANTDDLDALDAGVTAYKARPVSQGISDDAINRAVFLKQNYYPISTYNKSCWDLSYFEKYPLVGPIPDYEIGKLYTGDLPGGSKAVNGLIPIDAIDIIGQDIGGKFSGEGLYTSTAQQLADAAQKKQDEENKDKLKNILIISGIGLVVLTTTIIIIVKRSA